ncbi:hypothetical protein DXG03_001934 [Asterophora parasitica]|uniref:Uncharacterized protein n=1 Tax=Asterophora parasitica TaxID=117018 RepID=A0A9P7G347_9AGAR|nr:hypothetical protein DXG03_001934 [Asterophora parasitica]
MDVESIRLDPELAHQRMALLGRELKCTKKIIEELKAGLVSGAAKESVPQDVDDATTRLHLKNEIDALKEN